MERVVDRISRRRSLDYLWDETEGLIFSAYFRKRNGEMREMTCRRHAIVDLVGGDLPYNPRERGLVPVMDMKLRQKQPDDCRRMVNISTLVSFNIHGMTFIVCD